MLGESFFHQVVIGVFTNCDPWVTILVMIILALRIKDVQTYRVKRDSV